MYAYGIYAYGKPSAEQFHTGCGPDNQNSTSTVGAGLESFKKLLPTRMTSSKKLNGDERSAQFSRFKT
jgi:hypothetical protein